MGIKLLLNLFVSAVGLIIDLFIFMHIDFRALTKFTTAISWLPYVFLLVDWLDSLYFFSVGHDVSPRELSSRYRGSALAKGLALGTQSTIYPSFDTFGLCKDSWH